MKAEDTKTEFLDVVFYCFIFSFSPIVVSAPRSGCQWSHRRTLQLHLVRFWQLQIRNVRAHYWRGTATWQWNLMSQSLWQYVIHSDSLVGFMLEFLYLTIIHRNFLLVICPVLLPDCLPWLKILHGYKQQILIYIAAAINTYLLSTLPERVGILR